MFHLKQTQSYQITVINSADSQTFSWDELLNLSRHKLKLLLNCGKFQRRESNAAIVKFLNAAQIMRSFVEIASKILINTTEVEMN